MEFIAEFSGEDSLGTLEDYSPFMFNLFVPRVGMKRDRLED